MTDDNAPLDLEASPPFEELVGMAADIASLLSWESGHGGNAIPSTLGCHQPLHTFSPAPSQPMPKQGTGY